jgi:hypothetical protein
MMCAAIPSRLMYLKARKPVDVSEGEEATLNVGVPDNRINATACHGGQVRLVATRMRACRRCLWRCHCRTT